MLTNAAGIGGGGAILPILMMFGFSANVGVALANTIILIGAVTRFFFEFNTQHPSKKATLVDYSIVILMLPAVMVGSFVGAQLNIIMPETLLLFLLGSILIYISVKTTRQAMDLYEKDREAAKSKTLLEGKTSQDKKDNESIDSEEIGEVELQNLEDHENSWIDSVYIKHNDSFNTKTLKQIRKDERSHFQRNKLTIIGLSFLSLVIISLLRRNVFEAYIGHIKRFGFIDTLLCLIFLGSCLFLLLWSIKIIKHEYLLKKTVKYEFIDTDVQWESNIIFKMSTISSFGGLMASLVGLGGGVVYNPLMLEFKVHPRIAGSTSMYLILLGTLSSTVQYFFMGLLPYDYALGLGLLIVVATLIGNYSVTIMLKKMGQPSLVAILLAGVIILCTVIVLGASVYKVI